LYLGFEQPLPSNVWTTLYFVVSGAQATPAERRRILDAVRRTSSVSTPALPSHHDARVVWEYLADSGGTTQWLPLEADDDTRSLTLSGSVRVRTGEALRAQAIGQVARPLYYLRGRLASGALDEAPRLERIFVNGVEMVQSSAVSQTWSV